MKEKRIGIIMHGVTGRMGMNQHLIRSILEIRKQGGVALKDGTRLMPDPLLVGRNAAKIEELARKHGIGEQGPKEARRIRERVAAGAGRLRYSQEPPEQLSIL